MFIDCFSGREKSRKASKSAPSCSIGIDRFSSVHDIHGNGLQKYQKHIQLCRFFACIPGKVENGKLRMLCFAVVFLVFWSTLPVFWSRMEPVHENLPSRAIFIGVWEGKSCEIVCENHQYSLGLN